MESGHEPSRKADSVSGLSYYIDCYLIAQYYKYGQTNYKCETLPMSFLTHLDGFHTLFVSFVNLDRLLSIKCSVIKVN